MPSGPVRQATQFLVQRNAERKLAKSKPFHFGLLTTRVEVMNAQPMLSTGLTASAAGPSVVDCASPCVVEVGLGYTQALHSIPPVLYSSLPNLALPCSNF